MKKILIPALILMVVLCACAAKNIPVEPTEPVDTNITNEPVVESKKTYKATLYFASEDAMYLIPEEREIKYEEESALPLTIINLLKDGPNSANLYPVLNKDSGFKSVTVDNGVAIVSLDENFISLNSGGVTKEFMALYSVVNSLCEFENIDSVRFADHNGNIIEEFGGYIIDLPLTKDTTLAD